MGRVEEEREGESKVSVERESDEREREQRRGEGGLYVEEVAVRFRREERETGVG